MDCLGTIKKRIIVLPSILHRIENNGKNAAEVQSSYRTTRHLMKFQVVLHILYKILIKNQIPSPGEATTF